MLTPGFTIVDYQATPSGYYQIAFRNANGQTIIATQHGRGGCNHYTQPYGPIKDELDKWLEENAALVVKYLIAIGFEDLADVVLKKENEWQDTVVMSICDLIDIRKVRVQG